MTDDAKELANAHWEYIEALLVNHRLAVEAEIIKFHYISAFIHGFKHAMEEK